MSYNFNDDDQREAAMAEKWAECCEENTILRQQLAEFKHGQDAYQQLFNNEKAENIQLRQQFAALDRQNKELKEALIRWRSQAFPGTDQRIVIERDFPTVVRPSVS